MTKNKIQSKLIYKENQQKFDEWRDRQMFDAEIITETISLY